VNDDGNRWVRVSRGCYLLGIGTFLLLTTQNLLPTTFWADAAAYWPVLLVAIGIRLVFERSPFPGLVLLGPVLVLGTLMYVAMRPGGTGTQGDWTMIRLERPADVSACTLEGRLAFASLNVQSRHLSRNLLAEGRTTEAGRHSVRVEETAGGRVQVTNSVWKNAFLVLPGRRRARCELGVPAGLPVVLDLDLAFTATRLDVAATPVSRLSIDGAFNDLGLHLGAPSTDVRFELDGAFNQVEIEVPAGTPVRVTTDGVFNVVDRGGGAAAAEAGTGDAPGYRVALDGAFNRVVVRTR
jgi:cell wall-active antibiotic response 4TMS protein YvqF